MNPFIPNNIPLNPIEFYPYEINIAFILIFLVVAFLFDLAEGIAGGFPGEFEFDDGDRVKVSVFKPG